jgi:hypothetical protein
VSTCVSNRPLGLRPACRRHDANAHPKTTEDPDDRSGHNPCRWRSSVHHCRGSHTRSDGRRDQQRPFGVLVDPSGSHPACQDRQFGSGKDAATIITLADASAPTRYDFGLTLPTGAAAQLASDDSVVVLDQGGNPLGSFLKPWAKDATGKNLATEYGLNGSTLTQIVHTEGATFPVTADPHYTWGWVTGTIYFNKTETKLMALGGTIVSWLPSPATMWGGRSLAALAAYAVATNQCIKWKIWAIGIIAGGPLLYQGGYCT